jgi:DUF1365 family protein
MPAHFADVSILPEWKIGRHQSLKLALKPGPHTARICAPLLTATFHGRRHALTTAALLRSFLSLPLVTFKIVAAIHWEALRLWLKGARSVPRGGAAPANTAFNTGLAIQQHADYIEPTLSAAGREPGSRESALVR